MHLRKQAVMAGIRSTVWNVAVVVAFFSVILAVLFGSYAYSAYESRKELRGMGFSNVDSGSLLGDHGTEVDFGTCRITLKYTSEEQWTYRTDERTLYVVSDFDDLKAHADAAGLADCI